MTNDEATALFDALNAELFEGRLPRFKVRLEKPFIPQSEGLCEEFDKLITIDPEVAENPQRLRETLLHEMCHVGALFHGAKFQRNLRRLLLRGEAWAAREITRAKVSTVLLVALKRNRRVRVPGVGLRPHYEVSPDYFNRLVEALEEKELLRVAELLRRAAAQMKRRAP